MKKQPTMPYVEGQWYSLPVDGGGYGVAIVTRVEKSRAKNKSIILAGLPQVFRSLPTLEAVQKRTIHDIRCMIHTGDTCITKGNWTPLGLASSFSHATWPLLPVPSSNREFANRDNDRLDYAAFRRSLIPQELHRFFDQAIHSVPANAMEGIIPDLISRGEDSSFYYQITNDHVGAYEQVRNIIFKNAKPESRRR